MSSGCLDDALSRLFNGDFDGLSRLITPNALFRSGLFGNVTGRDSVIDRLRSVASRRPLRTYAITSAGEYETAIIAELTVRFSPGNGSGEEATAAGAVALGLEHGMIANYADYFDTGPLLLALGVPDVAVSRLMNRRNLRRITFDKRRQITNDHK